MGEGSRKEEVGREIGSPVSGAGDLYRALLCLLKSVPTLHHEPHFYDPQSMQQYFYCISISVNVCSFLDMTLIFTVWTE